MNTDPETGEWLLSDGSAFQHDCPDDGPCPACGER